MHQIRFRLGLRLRPRWESSQRSPRSPRWILRGPTSNAGEGRKEGTTEGRRKGQKGKREKGGERQIGEGRRAEGTRGPPIEISGYATEQTPSKCIQNTRANCSTFARHLLDVCSIYRVNRVLHFIGVSWSLADHRSRCKLRYTTILWICRA